MRLCVCVCVSPHLCRCLEPSHEAVLLAELLHLNSVIREHVPTLVTFVRQKHGGYVFPIGKCQFGVQVLLPFGHSLERGGPRDVKDDEGAHGLPVVHAGHVAEPLLTWKAHARTRTQTHKHYTLIFTSPTSSSSYVTCGASNSSWQIHFFFTQHKSQQSLVQKEY